jgi:hypothetical protein
MYLRYTVFLTAAVISTYKVICKNKKFEKSLEICSREIFSDGS